MASRTRTRPIKRRGKGTIFFHTSKKNQLNGRCAGGAGEKATPLPRGVGGARGRKTPPAAAREPRNVRGAKRAGAEGRRAEGGAGEGGGCAGGARGVCLQV